ncbi:TetR/AcrR family transcriptional regulator [Mycobacteroides chelonae]|uniref:TetR/AcrR family transcriptional regulator n=1 Tax=Mycobacteroides chelonae TaxID=1774 RepID=UPI0013F4FB0B|nr:TetR/AcrR family transcriptional regulator [Mycobacteroides chelonae]
MVEQPFQRARTSAHKRLREKAFLAAARVVIDRNGVRTTTLTDIANETGLHYSAVRRYFRSLDAVMLQLVVEGWECWAYRVGECVAFRSAGTEEMVQILVSTLTSDRVFCELLGSLPTYLSGASEHELRLAKARVSVTISQMVTVMHSAAPQFSRTAAEELVTFAVALTAAMPHVCQIAGSGRTASDQFTQGMDIANQLRRLIPTTALGT